MRGRSTIGSASRTSRCEPHGQVRATRADKQLTNKRRTKNEQRTNKRRCEPHEQIKKRRTKNEQMMVRVARTDKEMTNKKRTMSEGKRVVIGNKNNSRFCEKCKNESYKE
ncbi:hypothetical protein [Capnocytophaga ochracea]|uniref:hypothetical protein n=1 Tax=Capnocytophaga ochracea TaxID=1018 RepID=UPI0015ECC5FD|nr:hypothetical protein [Capnocytophaga ochracea]